MLDGAAMADGHAYFAIGSWRVSPDNTHIMYAVDTVSRRKYSIYFKNLETGVVLEDVLPLANPNLVWANDSKTIFYSSKDANTLRWDKIHRYEIGKKDSDEVIYTESDETFSTGVGKTNSGKYILIGAQSTLSTEYHYLLADEPIADPRLFAPRADDEEYQIDHHEGQFLIRTNKGATNFKIMECPENNTDRSAWVTLIEHRDDVLLRDLTIFKEALVLTEQTEGKTLMRVINNSTSEEYYIDFPEEAYTIYTSGQQDYEGGFVRMFYSSLTTPEMKLEAGPA